jgi:hypothetical protein
MLILTGSAAAACASSTLFWRILTGRNPHPQHSQSPRHGCQPAADALLPLRTAAISTLHQPPHALLAKSASDIKSQKPAPPARAGPLHALLQPHAPPALHPAHSASQAAAHCPHPQHHQAPSHSRRSDWPCQHQTHSPHHQHPVSRLIHLLAKSASDIKPQKPAPPAHVGPLHAVLQQHVPPALPPAHSSSQAAAHCPHPPATAGITP